MADMEVYFYKLKKIATLDLVRLKLLIANTLG